jgi:hypothetical protein
MAKAMSLYKGKKKAIRTTKAQLNVLDRKHIGNEPTLNPLSTKIEIMRALGWYNHMYNSKTHVEFLMEYLAENDKKLLKHVGKLDMKSIDPSVCRIARMKMLNEELPKELLTKLEEGLEKLRNRKIEIIQKTEENTDGQTNVISIRARVEEKGESLIAELENIIDSGDWTFSLYNYFTAHSTPKAYTKIVADYYAPLLEELQEASANKDKQLKEAYSCYSRKEIKLFEALVQSIIDDCDKYSENKKREKAPKKKKTVSAEALFKNFKYQKADNDMKIVSIDPHNILQAAELFTYNTKYKLVTHLVAEEGKTLGVHGMAITNYDEQKSSTRRVGRKADEAVQKILNLGKKPVQKYVEELNKNGVTLHRVNENVVLLRITKAA